MKTHNTIKDNDLNGLIRKKDVLSYMYSVKNNRDVNKNYKTFSEAVKYIKDMPEYSETDLLDKLSGKYYKVIDI